MALFAYISLVKYNRELREEQLSKQSDNNPLLWDAWVFRFFIRSTFFHRCIAFLCINRFWVFWYFISGFWFFSLSSSGFGVSKILVDFALLLFCKMCVVGGLVEFLGLLHSNFENNFCLPTLMCKEFDCIRSWAMILYRSNQT